MNTYFRFWPVFLRNLLVWRKLAIPSLVANIAEPLMWLVAFGYGLGALVGDVTLGEDKVPYILFLASGSICMSAMQAASFEALYSAFSRMHVQKTWDGIMNAPVRLDDVVLAEIGADTLPRIRVFNKIDHVGDAAAQAECAAAGAYIGQLADWFEG